MNFEMFEDRKVQLLLVAGLVAYVSLVNPTNLPTSVKDIINNTYVKIGILVLIAIRAHYDVTTAVLLAVAFVVTLNCANQTEGFKNFGRNSGRRPRFFSEENYEGDFQTFGVGQAGFVEIRSVDVKSIYLPGVNEWRVTLFDNFNNQIAQYNTSISKITNVGLITKIRLEKLDMERNPML
jgi:hypothetical protein